MLSKSEESGRESSRARESAQVSNGALYLGGETVIYETYDRTSVESFRGMQLCYRIQLDQHPRDGSFARLQGRPRCSRSTTFLGHETEPGLPTHLGPPSQRRSTLAGRAPRS